MTPQKQLLIDKRITFLQYLNTVLLGLLTLAVGLGVNQMNEWNKSYDYIIINQANILKDIDRITEKCEEYNERISTIEAVMPKETEYKRFKTKLNGK